MELSGIVAILSEDGNSVIEIRNLGPDPVAVKAARVLPLEDNTPDVPEGFHLGEPIYDIQDDKVVRTWALEKNHLPDLQPYQFFAVLEISGMKASVDAFINSLPSPQNIIARSKLENTLSFERNNDLVLAAQAALHLTDKQLDQLWLQAATL